MTTDDLSTLIRNLNEVLDQQTGQLESLRTTVDEQNAQLDLFVPKRRFRWAIAAVVVAIIAAVVLVLVFRERDADEAERRRAQLELDQEQDRQNLLRGCERANDQRATLREIINLALSQSTVPPGLSPELAAIYRDAQARTILKRDELLALPGVQPVDCAAQFPTSDREA